MDKEKFFEIMDSGDVYTQSNCREIIHEQLKNSERGFALIADRGEYVRWGGSYGIGFVCGIIREVEGMAQVVVKMGAKLDKDKIPVVRKLFRKYNRSFKIPGLSVEDDGTPLFESEPFNLASSKYAADKMMSLALSTVHAYQGVLLAVDAGVEPWELLDYNNDDSGGNGCDDDDDPGFYLEDLVTAIRAHRTEPLDALNI